MLSVLWWLLEHWWLVLAAGAVTGAYIIGGWRLALAVATLGAAWRLYESGEQRGKADAERRAAAARAKAQQTRKDVDDEIDSLGAADVDQRLARWLRDDPER